MSIFVYPRLPLSFAKKRISEIQSAYESGGMHEVQELVDTDHPQAAPVATGGRAASRAHIANVRSVVTEALKPWQTHDTVPRAEVATYDMILGRALHESLQIIPADAAHDETWAFLTLVVFPDVAVRRFPDMKNERLLGTPRNVLRRTWFREEVIGDLQKRAKRPLGEDELVGLFERSALARNHALVRSLAAAVIKHEAGNRSDWARELYKQVTFATGPRLLDTLSEDELDDLIRNAMRDSDKRLPSTSYTRPAATERFGSTDQDLLRGSSSTPETVTLNELTSGIAAGSSEGLEARFMQSLIQVCQRAGQELNYDLQPLLDTAIEEGAAATAARTVMSDRLSEEFIFLWKHQRLDLTVEALVTEGEFTSLFEREVVACAAQRLRDYRTK